MKPKDFRVGLAGRDISITLLDEKGNDCYTLRLSYMSALRMVNELRVNMTFALFNIANLTKKNTK